MTSINAVIVEIHEDKVEVIISSCGLTIKNSSSTSVDKKVIMYSGNNRRQLTDNLFHLPF